MDAVAKFAAAWQKVRENTIATAQDMPEDHYDSAPFADMWTFRRQLTHVLNIADVMLDALDRGEFDRSKFGVDNYATQTKVELIAALEENFRAQTQQLVSRPDSFLDTPRKSFDGSDTTAGQLLQMLKEHEIAHCNQLYVYLRSKGMVPPTTRKRNAARAVPSAK